MHTVRHKSAADAVCSGNINLTVNGKPWKAALRAQGMMISRYCSINYCQYLPLTDLFQCKPTGNCVIRCRLWQATTYIVLKGQRGTCPAIRHWDVAQSDISPRTITDSRPGWFSFVAKSEAPAQNSHAARRAGETAMRCPVHGRKKHVRLESEFTLKRPHRHRLRTWMLRWIMSTCVKLEICAHALRIRKRFPESILVRMLGFIRREIPFYWNTNFFQIDGNLWCFRFFVEVVFYS